jgi:hypothetical protein
MILPILATSMGNAPINPHACPHILHYIFELPQPGSTRKPLIRAHLQNPENAENGRIRQTWV